MAFIVEPGIQKFTKYVFNISWVLDTNPEKWVRVNMYNAAKYTDKLYLR